jgi:hypothetical protein
MMEVGPARVIVLGIFAGAEVSPDDVPEQRPRLVNALGPGGGLNAPLDSALQRPSWGAKLGTTSPELLAMKLKLVSEATPHGQAVDWPMVPRVGETVTYSHRGGESNLVVDAVRWHVATDGSLHSVVVRLVYPT